MGTLETSAFDVIGINRKSIFTLEEARTLFPVIYRVTKSYADRVQAMLGKADAPTAEVEAEAGRLIDEWRSKVQKLGGLPNGQWVVDFDSGDGYFCWKYPERSLEFWHHYRDGFSKRILLSALKPVTEPASFTVEKSL